MFRSSATLLLFTAVIGLVGCDTVPQPNSPTFVGSNTPRTELAIPTPTITSLSPATAEVGGDVTVTITGTGFTTSAAIPSFPTTKYYSSFALWHTGPDPSHLDHLDPELRTRVISDTQLTAVVPASLLTGSTATISIVNGDVMGWADGVDYPESNRVNFDVTGR